MGNKAPTTSVFLEISIDGKKVGRLEIDFFNKTPKTNENFRALCTGEKGVGKQGKPLHFKGCKFHKILPGQMAACGDIINGDGTGGESIFSKDFKDENLKNVESNVWGDLCMVNSGPNSNNSQFFICFGESIKWAGKHTVFGRVRDFCDNKVDVLGLIERFGSGSGEPTREVTISDCGECPLPMITN